MPPPTLHSLLTMLAAIAPSSYRRVMSMFVPVLALLAMFRNFSGCTFPGCTFPPTRRPSTPAQWGHVPSVHVPSVS
jgi:hypothetical protein